MAFNKKEWMRSYMRRYRRRKRRKPRPDYFDKKAWSRPYMREYMRKRRAKEKVERERNEAINAAIARQSSPAPTAGLSGARTPATRDCYGARPGGAASAQAQVRRDDQRCIDSAVGSIGSGVRQTAQGDDPDLAAAT